MSVTAEEAAVVVRGVVYTVTSADDADSKTDDGEGS